MTREQKSNIAYKYVTEINNTAKDDAYLLEILCEMINEIEKNLFTKSELKYAYNSGATNIDSDGCYIDEPEQDFKTVIEEIKKDRK